MWQQSHGRWPFLMRRKVCLTNYPGGQTTCLFWSRIFMSALSLKLFFSRLLSICAEPWHLTPIFAFKLALPITTYWLSAITYCLFSLFFHFLWAFSNTDNELDSWANCSSPWPQVRQKSHAPRIVWHEIYDLQSGSNQSSINRDNWWLFKWSVMGGRE